MASTAAVVAASCLATVTVTSLSTQTASAVGLSCSTGVVYGTNATGQIAAINATTGAAGAASAFTMPAATTADAFGVGLAGDHIYVVANPATVTAGSTVQILDIAINAATQANVTSGPITNTLAAGGFVAGGVNAATGIYYIAGTEAASPTTTDIYAFDTNTNTWIGLVGTITGMSAGMTIADLAFDASGAMYAAFQGSGASAGIVNVAIIKTPPTTPGAAAVTIAAITNRSMTGLIGFALDNDGTADLATATQVTRAPVPGLISGGTAATSGFSPLTDIASCNIPGTIKLRKIFNSAHATGATLTVLGPNPYSVAAGINTTTTTGTALGLQAEQAGPVLVAPGSTYSINESFFALSMQATLTCVDTTHGNAVLPVTLVSTSTNSNVYSLVAPALSGSPAIASNVLCTYTNGAAPTVKVAKQTVGGVGTFAFDLVGLSNTSDTLTTVASGTTVTSSLTSTGTAGVAASVVEQLTSANGWATSYSCVDANSANTGTSPVTGTGTGAVVPATSMVPGSAWTCTFSNTKAINTAFKTAYFNGAPATASTAVTPGSTVTYVISEQSNNTVNPVGDITMTDTMSTNQTYVGSTLGNANAGWNLTNPAGGSTFNNTLLATWPGSTSSTCSSTAAQFLYGANAQYGLGSLPWTQNTITAGTNGDGYNPIFINDANCNVRLVAVNHLSTGVLNCYNVTLNQTCTGAAPTMQEANFSYSVVGSKVYIGSLGASSATNYVFRCYDFSLTPAAACASVNNPVGGATGLGNSISSLNTAISNTGGNLGYLNGRLYALAAGFAGGGGALALACFDLTTNTACTSGTNVAIAPGGIGVNPARWAPMVTDQVNLSTTPNGNKFVGSYFGSYYCIAITGVNTVTNCNGTTPVAPISAVPTTNGTWLPRTNSSGTVTGFCILSGACFDTNGQPSGTTTLFGNVTDDPWGLTNGVSIRPGTSQIVFSNYATGLATSRNLCWDWSTGALCGTTAFASDPTAPYGTAFFPGSTNCFVSFGDLGSAGFQVWHLSGSPQTITRGCPSTEPVSFTFKDPAPRYCAADTAVGDWGNLTLTTAVGPIPIGTTVTYTTTGGATLATVVVTAAMGGGTAQVVIPKPAGVVYSAGQGIGISVLVGVGASAGARLQATLDNTTTSGAFPQTCYQATVVDCSVQVRNSVTIGGTTAYTPSTATTTLNCLPNPTLVVRKTSNGATGTFGYTLTGVSSPTDSITTATPGVGVTSATVHTGTAGTAATVNETSGGAGYSTSYTCTDANSATTGTSPISGTGTNATIPAGSMVAGAAWTCAYVNNKIPTVQVTKRSVGATGTFAFDLTGLSATGDSITTAVSGTVVNGAVNTGTVGQSATITEQAASATGYVVTWTCTDSNSATTGTAPISGTGTAATIPAGSMVAGAAWVCAYTDTVAPILDTVKTITAINGITVAPAGSTPPVQAGDTLQYTIKVTNTGAAAGSTTLTDAVPANTTYLGAAGETWTGCAVGAAAGTSCTRLVNVAANSSTSVTFTVKVDSPLPVAVTSITNTVTTTSGSCSSCTVTDQVPRVVTTKSSSPASGTTVATGSTITYTIQTVVTNGPTASATTINDVLTGASFVSITSTSAGLTCTSPANSPFCTLPAGAASGTYTVVYTATVTAAGGQSAHNVVTDSNGSCTPGTCVTDHPVPLVVTTKSSSPVSGTTVATGSTITYMISTTVTNGPTVAATTINDTLTGANFVSITSTSPGLTCTTPASTPFCTLPAGSASGTYTVVYTATVTAAGGQSAHNVVTDSNGTCTPGTCVTDHPVPLVVTTKSSSPASGTTVKTGDTITYTITTTITNGPTVAATTINDVLTGANFVAVTSASAGLTCTSPANTPFCTLPAGSASGTYTVVYTATVTATAGQSAHNVVTDSNGSCTPGTCVTDHPVPLVVTTKSSSPASGTTVKTGDTITYTITTTVSNGPTVVATTINDTLTGATFMSVTSTSAGLTCTSPANTPFCTLPAGSASGTYTVVYTATVTATGGQSAHNVVTDSNGSCTPGTCVTDHPVPLVVTTKSSSPVSGSTVKTGDTVTYMISTTVTNGPTVVATTVNDTLTGANFVSVTSASAGLTCTSPVNTPFCTLPAGTANGTYTVVYTATVTATGGQSAHNVVTDSNGSCTPGTCVTDHPVPLVVTTKSSSPVSGSTVKTGDTVTYTITTTVSNGPTVVATTINDTLTGASFVSVTSASAGLTCTSPVNSPFCTLPAGSANGTYTVVYTATVTAAGGQSAHNVVVDSDGSCTPGTCVTDHPVPLVVTTKSSSPANGTTVATGSTITYTITTTVSNGPTVVATTINDTLTGANFVSVTSTSAGLTCTSPVNSPFCTLPAGTANGVYSVVYTATVTATAGQSAHNVVTDSNGTCTPGTCVTDHPVPGVGTVKTSSPPSGTTVKTGDTITYTITTTITNGPTVAPATINDTLTGANFVSITSTSPGLTCTTPANIPFCTIPTGSPSGTYAVVYTATVTATAGQSAHNVVVDSNGTCTPGTCVTDHPVPLVVTTKSSSPPTGTTVKTGDTITYTITTTVTNGPTAQATTINDTLTGANFVAVTSASAGLTCTSPANTPFCTLPAGSANGVYSVVYTATVTATAGQSAHNVVVDSNGTCTPGTCVTDHPVPLVVTTKSSSPASGSTVKTGDTITYTITTTVSNGPTVVATTINDTLTGATFVSVTSTSAGLTCTTPANTPFCTLPAGTANGVYSVVYTATVTATAGQSAHNVVVDSNGTCTPGTCVTDHPVPSVVTTKFSSPPSGTTVKTGDTITYTITTTITNGPTVAATTINDTLTGASFVSVTSTSPGLTCTTPANTPFCTLPAGSASGTYTVVYTATVTAAGGQSAHNVVTDSNGSCTPGTCVTDHPVPLVVTVKSSNPVSGTAVKTGDTITYTIATTVTNGPTVVPTTINDTLTGASFVAVTSTTAGLTCTSPANTPFCTLPAGSANGTYTVVYTATVTATGGQSAHNVVTDSNGSCTPGTCVTDHPVAAISTTKSSNPPSGTTVKTGDTITYTITTTVTNGPTAQATTINDTLTGASFVSVTSTSAGLTCTTPANTPFCTLPAGTATGTYTVIYTATVTAVAGQSAHNVVVDSNGTCTPGTCVTDNPVPRVVTVKSSNPASGTTVKTGDTITYTIATTVTNGPTAQATTINDTLTGASFVSVTSASAGLTCTSPANTPFCTLPAGSANGTYTVIYTATVTATAGQSAHNVVVDSNGSCTPGTCVTDNPVPSVVTTKSSNPPSGSTVTTGATITYTITTTVTNGPTTTPTLISDTLTGATFVSVTSTSAGLTCTSPANTPFCTLPTGSASGTYSVVYTATVTASGGQSAHNVVTDSDNTCTPSTCVTDHPVPAVSTAKSSNPASGTTVRTGDTITYTITTTVSNGPTAQATTINDALTGATFVALTPATSAQFVCTTPASTPFCTLPAGTASGTYHVVYTATVTAVGGQSAHNVVTDSDNSCPAGANRIQALAGETCTTDHPVNPDPALDTVKTITTVNGQPATTATKLARGDVVVYRIAVTNTGRAAGTTTLTDRVPANTFYSGNAEGWSCTNPTAAGTDCTQTVTVAAGATVATTFTVTVDFDPNIAETVTQIVNTVTTSFGTCSSCTVANPLKTADLSVDKTVDQPEPAINTIVNFTVKLTNLGADPATGVRLTEIPAGLNYVSHTVTQGTYDPATQVWDVGDLAVGQVATLVISMRVVTGVATNDVVALPGREIDPNLRNNHARATVTTHELPRTGFDSQAMAEDALVVVAIGGGLVMIGRRRRRRRFN